VNLTRALIASALLATTVISLAACSSLPASDPTTIPTTDPTPSATQSASAATAWDPATGTITVGDGDHRIDVWVDPMCPYCAKFDAAQGDALARWVADGDARVVLHPLTFLDRVSNGSAYSTRAATALAAVGEQRPDALLPVLADLMEHQPAENTAGLDDEQIADIARAHGVDVRSALASRPHDALFARLSAEAFAGDGAITGTPTVRVDGAELPGESLYGPAMAPAVDRLLDAR
jgi:protein-disulfide isomerase